MSRRRCPNSPPPSAATMRQRRHRERMAAGRIVLQIEVHEVDTAQMLIGGGLLTDYPETRRELTEAASRQFEILADMDKSRY